VFGVHIAAADAENKFGAALAAVSEKVLAGANLLDAYSAKNRDAREAVNSGAQAAIAHAQSLYQEGAGAGVAIDVLARHREQLIASMIQHGLSRGAAQAYINTLGLTPENIRSMAFLDTAQATANAHQLDNTLNFAARNRVVSVYADVSSAEASLRRFNVELNDLERRVIAGNVNYGGRFADGGIVRHFASGGREDHSAQITRVLRVFGEPETGGEAYIPLGVNKRGKSLEILSQVAKMFGFGLVQMADGGLVSAAAELQQYLRTPGWRMWEDFSWAGMSDNAAHWNDMLSSLFYENGPGRSGDWFGSNATVRGWDWYRGIDQFLTDVERGAVGQLPLGAVQSKLASFADARSRGIGYDVGYEAQLLDVLKNTYGITPSPSKQPVHVHVNIDSGYVASEDQLGRTIVRHIAAAQRAGVKLPWATVPS
jgi:hypothetical protein